MVITFEEHKTIKIPGETSFLVRFPYDKNIVECIKNVSETACWHKDLKAWEIPLTSLYPVAEFLADYGVITIDTLEYKEKKKKEFKDIDLSQFHFKTTPYRYQEDGVKYGLNHDKFLLLDVPGLGKTPQAIWLAEAHKQRDGIEHCLIVCGVNTLKYNWLKEINFHSNLDAMILGARTRKNGKEYIGTVDDRVEDLKNPIDEFFIITNVETLRSADVMKQLTKKNPANKIDMIVVDEVHHCKTPTSQQGKNLLKLKAKYMVGMTGTLLTNSPMDAYVPLKWIGKERSTYTNYKYYYSRFTGPYNNIFVGYRNLEILKDEIEEYSLRRDKSLLDLPEKTVINEFIDMDNKQEKFYYNIVHGVKDDVDKVELNTATVLSLITRLRQATSCPTILTSEDIISSKIQRACELVEEIISSGEKVVIFSEYKETINKLNELLIDMGYSPLVCTGDVKDETVRDNIDHFQHNDSCNIILATSKKLGTGVTLTAGSYAIFIDCPWTKADCQQCEDRIHRVGSKKPVTIYYLWNTSTIDERVKEVVDSKEAVADFVVDGKIKNSNLLKKIILDL